MRVSSGLAATVSVLGFTSTIFLTSLRTCLQSRARSTSIQGVIVEKSTEWCPISDIDKNPVFMVCSIVEHFVKLLFSLIAFIYLCGILWVKGTVPPWKKWSKGRSTEHICKKILRTLRDIEV